MHSPTHEFNVREQRVLCGGSNLVPTEGGAAALCPQLLQRKLAQSPQWSPRVAYGVGLRVLLIYEGY